MHWHEVADLHMPSGSVVQLNDILVSKSYALESILFKLKGNFNNSTLKKLVQKLPN